MSAPVSHNLIVGAYLPLVKRTLDMRHCYYNLQDNYTTYFKRLGIRRDEMMILMPQMMTVDILVGNKSLPYIGEDETSN